MMELKSLTNTHGVIRAEYDVKHSTHGPSGTTLSQPLKLHIESGRIFCEMTIDGCDAPTVKEALEKMAAWLRRMADGIDRRTEETIPL